MPQPFSQTVIAVPPPSQADAIRRSVRQALADGARSEAEPVEQVDAVEPADASAWRRPASDR